MAQAVSLQELGKATVFWSHLELNCHLKELSPAFIPKKNCVSTEEVDKKTGWKSLCRPASPPFPMFKLKKMRNKMLLTGTGKRRDAGQSMSLQKEQERARPIQACPGHTFLPQAPEIGH